ncbi:MAG: AAA family ATPase, partial [Actinomycetales bacterium]
MTAPRAHSGPLGSARVRIAPSAPRFQRRVQQNVAMGHVVAFANQKGGVAKTTTVVTVAAALAELGRRVLVVDLDSQGCATFCLGFDPEDLSATIADAILGETKRSIGDVVLTAPDGVDLVPASLDLARADQALATTMGREYVLREALEP